MAEKVLVVPNMITVGELAERLDLPVTNLVGELFKNGIMATVNQRIDFETAQIIVEELGLDVELEQKQAGDAPVAEKRVLAAGLPSARQLSRSWGMLIMEKHRFLMLFWIQK